jgi:hypothetical protein
MNLANSIVEFGTQAVLRYREISSIAQDNELPEVFLGSFIAGLMHDRFKVPSHVEYPYLLLARNMGKQIDQADLINKFGGLRADVALFPAGEPPEIIEFKIVDEATSYSSVLADRDKMLKLAEFGPMRAYCGVLMCETSKAQGDLASRVTALQKAIGSESQIGATQLASNRDWSWCFVCFTVR